MKNSGVEWIGEIPEGVNYGKIYSKRYRDYSRKNKG